MPLYITGFLIFLFSLLHSSMKLDMETNKITETQTLKQYQVDLHYKRSQSPIKH